MPDTIYIAAAILCYLLVISVFRKQRYIHFPGPRRYPIIGTPFRPGRVWVHFSTLGQKYGPIFSFRLLRTEYLVLNTASAARELLEGKANNYWSRPVRTMIEMSGMHRGALYELDAVKLRHARNMLHQVLHPREMSMWRECIEKHVGIFVDNLAHTPEDLRKHIRGLPTGLTLEISHGYDIGDSNDTYVLDARRTLENFRVAGELGRWMVDWIPALRYLPEWLPFMGFKRLSRSFKEQYWALSQRGLDMVKQDMAAGRARPSVVSRALESPEKYDEESIGYTGTQVYSGGSDTSICLLLTVLLILTREPEAQRRAQAEIDRVAEGKRLPTYEDAPELPYTQALIWEIMRAYPVVPLVTRDARNTEVYHERYVVEKGTNIIVNFWAMLHDDAVYADPERFDPDRWLDGRLAAQGMSPPDIVFGFGKRICPGRALATAMVFTTVASVLATFDITPKKDAHGQPIVPPLEFCDGTIISPLPFACDIRPRQRLEK